jgi:hypothetical protein
MRSSVFSALVITLIALASVARAEDGEKSVSVEGTLLLPSFSSPDATAVALAALGVRARAEYGVTDDLSVTVGLGFSAFSGQTGDTRSYLGRPLSGNLALDLDQIQGEIGARYLLFGGYNLAPYVEAGVGVLFLNFRNEDLLDTKGESYGLMLPDESSVALTGSIGLRIEYRLMNLVRIGAGVRLTEVFGNRLYKRFIEVPLGGALYW